MMMIMMKNDDEPILSLICLVFVDTCHSVERIWSILFASLITILENEHFHVYQNEQTKSWKMMEIMDAFPIKQVKQPCNIKISPHMYSSNILCIYIYIY